jgi:DNA-binding transcriptional LysR family regulator
MELRWLRYFVAVAEERHIGRAAARLRMTQPPLSRAIHHLETDLGTTLFDRTPHGVELTEAGRTLYADARSLLDHADRLETRVRSVAGHTTLTVGSLADTVELIGGRIVPAFRESHPEVAVRIHEADLSDPTAGLRAGLVDVALTRLPFQDTGLHHHILHTEPIGLVVRADDPLASHPSVRLSDLPGRRWVQLPPDTDPVWRAYWTGPPAPGDHDPPMRTIQECLQAVLWNGMSALAPLHQLTPAGLVTVPVTDRPPSHLVLTRPKTPSPLIRSFVRIATRAYRRDTPR